MQKNPVKILKSQDTCAILINKTWRQKACRKVYFFASLARKGRNTGPRRWLSPDPHTGASRSRTAGMSSGSSCHVREPAGIDVQTVSFIEERREAYGRRARWGQQSTG